MPKFIDLPENVLTFLLTHKRIKFKHLNKSIDHPMDRYRNTALHSAASWGDLNLVTALLKGQANPNATDHMGETPLFRISGWNNPRPGEMLRVFIKHGADIRMVGRSKTLLDRALLSSDEMLTEQNEYKIYAKEIEKLEFSDKLNGLTIRSLKQGLGNTQSLFSAIAEAIYLKVKKHLKVQSDGRFEITPRLKKILKEYAPYTTSKEKLSDRVWQNLLEYGNRVHDLYVEQMEAEQQRLLNLSEEDAALAVKLVEQEVGTALQVYSSMVKDEPDQKEAREFVQSQVSKRLNTTAQALGSSNPAYDTAISSAVAFGLRLAALDFQVAAEEAVEHAASKESLVSSAADGVESKEGVASSFDTKDLESKKGTETADVSKQMDALKQRVAEMVKGANEVKGTQDKTLLLSGKPSVTKKPKATSSPHSIGQQRSFSCQSSHSPNVHSSTLVNRSSLLTNRGQRKQHK